MQHPYCWNGNTQMSGDTIFLFMQNKKPKLANVHNNAILINKTTAGIFNQLSGRYIEANFKDGELDSIRVKWLPAESIYYPQD